MPTFALFDFFQENAVDVGEWKWVMDYRMIDPELSKSTEDGKDLKLGFEWIETISEHGLTIIVQWPTNPKVLKSLGKKTIPVIENETKDCVAHVLKTGDDLQVLREIANRISKSPDISLSPDPEKRQRKRNTKYSNDENSEEKMDKPLVLKKRKKAAPAKTQDLKLSQAIEAELKSKLEAANGVSGEDETDDTDSDDYEDRKNLQKQNRFLEAENKLLKSKNKRLQQMLQDQKSISDILNVVNGLDGKLEKFNKKMDERCSSPCPGNYKTPPTTPLRLLDTRSESPTSSEVHAPTPTRLLQPTRSPLTSLENRTPELRMITLWEGKEIPEGQKKILNSKRGSVTDFTNTLLRMVFKLDELAESSLTGKTSNAFKNSKIAKPKLQDVDNVIAFIKSETQGAEAKVKASITQLLNTESKRKHPNI